MCAISVPKDVFVQNLIYTLNITSLLCTYTCFTRSSSFCLIRRCSTGLLRIYISYPATAVIAVATAQGTQCRCHHPEALMRLPPDALTCWPPYFLILHTGKSDRLLINLILRKGTYVRHPTMSIFLQPHLLPQYIQYLWDLALHFH